MLGKALYYPHIDIHDANWLRSAILFWDQIQTIAPTSIENPYQEEDTKICVAEGYLKPLRCDLHHDILDELGKRVLKLMNNPEWSRSISQGQAGGPSREALLSADKLGDELRWRMSHLVGIHPDKMPPELQMIFTQSGWLEILSADKLPPHFRRMMEDFEFHRMHREKLSRELRNLRNKRVQQHNGADWSLVDGRFAEI